MDQYIPKIKEMAQFRVNKVTTLGWKNDTKVVQILEKVCSQIQPILCNHKWNVGLLLEFYPNDKALLGLNVGRGQTIKVRCRLPNDKNAFYEYNHIIGTVLHELAHNEIANHGPKFQKLWDKLWEELEALEDNNFNFGVNNNANNFFGHKFGGGCGQKSSTKSHNPESKRQARNLGALAAEKRKRYQTLMPPENHKLYDGKTPRRNQKLNAKQLAAQAALKRFKKLNS